MRFLARLQNLVRGLLGQWIGRREHKHPGAVYEAAIQERIDQYGKLREAAAGVLYVRTKLGKELAQKTAELGRIGRQLELAVDADDDEAAVALIGRRDSLGQEVARLTAELRELETEADAAKRNLTVFHTEIARLRDEKVHMLARLANARARLKFQETLHGLSPDADIRALDAVREHVERLVQEAKVSRDLGDSDLEERLGKIRAAEADAAARAQLEELKRARRSRLLPLVIPTRSAAPSGLT